ncbi:MAG: transposase [Planctomycetes bacterium]|nr:transposase [Planctomycetota bacterium]
MHAGGRVSGVRRLLQEWSRDLRWAAGARAAVLQRRKNRSRSWRRKPSRGFASCTRSNARRRKPVSTQSKCALRRAESIPRLERLRDWMAATRPKVLDKGRLAQAIDYSLSNWTALMRYCEDGRLDIDNNAAERRCARSRSAARTGSSSATNAAGRRRR